MKKKACSCKKLFVSKTVCQQKKSAHMAAKSGVSTKKLAYAEKGHINHCVKRMLFGVLKILHHSSFRYQQYIWIVDQYASLPTLKKYVDDKIV